MDQLSEKWQELFHKTTRRIPIARRVLKIVSEELNIERSILANSTYDASEASLSAFRLAKSARLSEDPSYAKLERILEELFIKPTFWEDRVGMMERFGIRSHADLLAYPIPQQLRTLTSANVLCYKGVTLTAYKESGREFPEISDIDSVTRQLLFNEVLGIYFTNKNYTSCETKQNFIDAIEERN